MANIRYSDEEVIVVVYSSLDTTIVDDFLLVSCSLLHVFEIPLSIIKLPTLISLTYYTDKSNVPERDDILQNFFLVLYFYND
jgi:hypothetical protein